MFDWMIVKVLNRINAEVDTLLSHEYGFLHDKNMTWDTLHQENTTFLTAVLIILSKTPRLQVDSDGPVLL